MRQQNSAVTKMAAGLVWALLVLSMPGTGLARENRPGMVLADAVMCQGIKNYKPVGAAVVFSISLGEVFCYSSFDPVYETTYIYHKWYKRDQLIFTMRLTLSPPKWASFSRIQIRDADKGPWRVQIEDDKANLLETLRFSMAD